ncbi:MAG TPA: hypothetical protein ENI17_08325 [Pseudomonas xinjiangensis]|uniref:LPS-assembly lipoprotein LptE n=2 Tax=root TaxID=1 RepID=A0A7V1BNY3_9GAMM|nr:hypothetical protein [Halopseudomonas xinjiangensis]HEC47620.1 hypothetical protein [Halopseudomonas xinjiangensis]
MLLKRPLYVLTYLLLGVTLFLSGCGFQLRGTGVDSIKLEQIRLSSNEINSPIYRQLRDTLEAEGVEVTDTARYHLQLLESRNERSALSYTGRASAAEIEIRQYLTFQITDTEGRVLIGPETLTTQRVYINDRDNIVGTGEEEDLLIREMRQDMTRQMLFRLASLTESDLAAREQALDSRAP